MIEKDKKGSRWHENVSCASLTRKQKENELIRLTTYNYKKRYKALLLFESGNYYVYF